METEKNKFSIIYLLVSCFIYRIKPNMRLITLDWNSDFSWLKIYCITDSMPTSKDFELMEDVVSLYESFHENNETEVELSVEFDEIPFDKINPRKYILYARYEE